MTINDLDKKFWYLDLFKKLLFLSHKFLTWSNQFLTSSWKYDKIINNIMSSSVIFTTKDIENIISWFERVYSSDDEMSDYERETYLKLAKYFILDEKSMS